MTPANLPHPTSSLQGLLVKTNQKYRPAASTQIIRLLPLFSLVTFLSLVLTPSDKLTAKTVEIDNTTQGQLRQQIFSIDVRIEPLCSGREILVSG